MADDKLKQGISVLTTFTDGEQPTARKLNTIASQLRWASEQLERAVGDIHTDSWPYSASTTTTLSAANGKNVSTGLAFTGAEERTLDIVNLSRLIGPASNLNPRMLAGETSITESVPTAKHEFSLRYPVSGTRNASNPTFSDGAVFENFTSNPSVAGDYNVTEDGKVFCVTASNGGTAEYTANPTTWGQGLGYQGATFNVIPDPNQTTGSGPSLVFGAPDASGSRTITLPVANRQQSDITVSSALLDDEDVNFERQLELPTVLQDNLSPGDLIPGGFLYLKNETTKEVYTDASYTYNGASSVIIGGVDITADIDNGHSFSIITVGTDITTSIDDLRAKSFHSHDRSFGEPFVQLDGITGFIAEASASGPYVPSQIAGNFAPQYLHRDGWDTSVDDTYNDRNSMRGDLMMANSTLPQGARSDNASDTTNKILFGDVDTSIFRNSTNELRIRTKAQGLDIRPNGVSKVKLDTAVGGVNVGNNQANTLHLTDTDLDLSGGGLYGSVPSAPAFTTQEPIKPYAFEVTVISGTAVSGDTFTLRRLGSTATGSGPGNHYTFDRLPDQVSQANWYSVNVLAKDNIANWHIPGAVGIGLDYAIRVLNAAAPNYRSLQITLGTDLVRATTADMTFRVVIWYDNA